MKDNFEEYKEFFEYFGTDEQCREYLYYLRWPNGYCCPNCGHVEARKQTEIQYRCRKCRKLTSLYDGTIFERTHLPLSKWYLAVLYVSKQRNNAKELQMLFNVGSNRPGSRHTVLRCLNLLEIIMFNSEEYKLNSKITFEELMQNIVKSNPNSYDLCDEITEDDDYEYYKALYND